MGIGLRWSIVDDILDRPPPELAWLEVNPENYMRRGGMFPRALEQCLERWPVVTHGLSLSIGGFDSFDPSYMRTLRDFIDRVRSPWHSDHLCFSSVDGIATHDLLPLPHNEVMVQHVVDRIRRAQDMLNVPFAVENISMYAVAPGAELTEAEFIREVVTRSGCLLLLDVNNLYVNSQNHGFDIRGAIEQLPLNRVCQIHVAGHEVIGTMRIDTHAEDVSVDVMKWLDWVIARTGPAAVLLERDDHFPPWEHLCAEIGALDAVLRRSR